MLSYFEFGSEDGIPYLDMGSSASSVKMRLTNTRLSFVQPGDSATELAYFSDNRLFITKMEAVERDFHRYDGKRLLGHRDNADRRGTQMENVKNRRCAYAQLFGIGQ